MNHKIVVALAGSMILAAGCKTAASGTKDAETTAIKAALPPGLYAKKVPADQIEKWVPAATGANGIPATLNGLWWTDAQTVHFVVSFRNVVWNPVTRTASLLFLGPGMYSVPASATDPAVTPEFYGQYNGYDMVFSPDLKTATLQPAYSDASGNRVVEPANVSGYTMQYVEDGHWVRHTVGRPDYQLRRIVQGDGVTHDPAYANYVKALGPQMLVGLPEVGLNEANPQATVSLGAADTQTYVAVNVATQGIFRITATSNAPLTLSTMNPSPFNNLDFSQSAVTTGSLLVYNIGAGAQTPTLGLSKTASTAASISLQLQPQPSLSLSDQQGSGLLNFAPGEQDALVQVTSSSATLQRYTLAFTGAVPLTLTGYQAALPTLSSVGGSNSLIVTLGAQQVVYVAVHAQQALTSTAVSLQPLSISDGQVAKSTVALSSNGTAVNDKLATMDTVNLYSVPLPTAAPGNLQVTINDANGNPHCCIVAENAPATDFASLTSSYQVPSGFFTITTPQFAVRYVGDLNAASPALAYSISVSPGS